MKIRVSGEDRGVSVALWIRLRGPKPPYTFECDGCSNSPESYRTWRGRVYKIWPACVIHDFHYRTEGALTRDAAGRKRADRIFRENVEQCVAHCGGSRIDQRRLAWLYWGRVRMWGATSFRHWAKGAKPTGWFRRLREVW